MLTDGNFREWQVKAACRGPQAAVFYPPGSGGSRDDKRLRELRAKAICDRCVVAGQCLEFAVDCGEVHGVWGGTNEYERRVLLGI